MNILKAASRASKSLSKGLSPEPAKENNAAQGQKATNESAALKPPRDTKASRVEMLLQREDGASLEALCEATGWKPHTCRAFLTGLRKKGRDVVRYSNADGKSVYRIEPDTTGGKGS